MAAPSVDWLNDTIDAVVTALKASPAFMSASAPSPPAGAAGVVMRVEDYLPETRAIRDDYLPHAGVVYLGDEFLAEESSVSESEIAVEIGIRLYHRGADRRAVWRKVLKAAAAIHRVVALEMNGDGDDFGGVISNALYLGGNAIESEEASGFGALQLIRIECWITRPDY